MKIIRDSEKAHQYVFASAIILFISSLFMPLVFVFFIQETLYHSKSYWFYEAPTSAYVTFGIGMVWIAIVLFGYLFIKWKFEPRFLKTITMLLLCISIPFFMFGVANYYYVDDEGLHFNYLNTFNQVTTYEWKDLKEVKEIYEKSSSGTVYLKEYAFITKDNKVETLPLSGKIGGNQLRLKAKLTENGVRMTSNYEDMYE